MDGKKIIFWIVTALLCLMMLGSAGMYIVNHESVAMIFENLHYPTYIIYPLAIAKILGVIAIITNFSKNLKEWAYAGFFYDLILAASAHYFSGVPSPLGAVAGLVLLFVSYILDKKVRG
ncbi:MAG: DoxX family protein [Pyrinomonadaceae bacterium]